MRFPSKKSFVRVSLLFIFALPTLAVADPDPAAAGSHFLTLEQAKTAFGSQFSVVKSADSLKLFGETSKTCLSNFDISNSGDAGSFQIQYKGDATGADCLDHDKATKGLGEDAKVSLASGADGQMTMTGDFDHVYLIRPRTYTDAGGQDELFGEDGNPISHESAAHATQRMADEAMKAKKDKLEAEAKVVATCTHGLSELNVREGAIDRLEKEIGLLGKSDDDKDMKDKFDADFFADARDETRRKEFRACRRQILRTKIVSETDDTMDDDDVVSKRKSRKASKAAENAKIDCSDKLIKIADADPSYVKRIVKIYENFINKQIDLHTNGVEKSYEAAQNMLDKLRAFADAENVDQDQNDKIDALEQKMNLSFLKLAAAKGKDSDDFKTMSVNVSGYLTNGDADHCFVNKDEGTSALAINSFARDNAMGLDMPLEMNPEQYGNSDCAGKAQLLTALRGQTALALKNQNDLNNQAAIVQLNSNFAACTDLRNALKASGGVMDPTQDASCKTTEAKVAAMKAAQSNLADASTVATNPNPTFGQTTTVPSTIPVATQTTVTAPTNTLTGSSVRRLTR